MTAVLVTDGEQRTALAIVRSLGSRGHTVHVCGAEPRTLAGSSRHAARRHVVSSPLRDAAAYASAVARVAEAAGIDIVLPVTEAALLAILEYRHLFPGQVIPWPDLAIVRRVCDKQALTQSAPQFGIAVPSQWIANRTEDLAGASAPFPVVLKPARSVIEDGKGRQKLGVGHAANAEELTTYAEALAPQAYPVLVQQRVQGPGVGVFLLIWNGELRAVFSHIRLREKPPSGGVSVYRESIAADSGLVERSRRFLAHLGWNGVAMIEYKVEAATGVPYLMEINGRFWGSLQLAVDAGVDFPAMLVDLVRGKDPGPIPVYRTGVRSRWWWGDVDHLIARLKHSDQALNLPPGAPGRAHTIREFLKLWRPGDRNEIFRWHDPVPLLWETLTWLRRR